MSSGVDSAQFRELCGRFVTGVVVVTASGGEGSPAGMTANSFASVSLDPPLISINIDRATDFHAVITKAAAFAISVLSSDQEAVSRRFASTEPDKFAGVGYHTTDHGLIVLNGVIASIECETVHRFDAGDHTIVVGRVIGGEVHAGRPLLYVRGGYGALA